MLLYIILFVIYIVIGIIATHITISALDEKFISYTIKKFNKKISFQTSANELRKGDSFVPLIFVLDLILWPIVVWKMIKLYRRVVPETKKVSFLVKIKKSLEYSMMGYVEKEMPSNIKVNKYFLKG